MTADAKRYYAMLGVDPTCSDEEIRHAFRRRAKELHPDSETGSASAFIHLKKAYDTLANPATRARYDRARLSRFRRQSLQGAPPPPPHMRGPRPGGISFARYAVAFAAMAGLSYGAIELMIDLSDTPTTSTIRSIRPATTSPRPTAVADEHPVEREATGFFDASTPTGAPSPHPDRTPSWPR